MGVEGGTTEGGGGMLLTTPAIVSLALRRCNAIEEMGANAAWPEVKVASADEGDIKTTKADEGGGARGSETLVIGVAI